MGLQNKMMASEYVYSRGHGSRDRADEVIGDAFAAGEVSPAENPRTLSYRNAAGDRRWAVVLTDLAAEEILQGG